MCLTSSWLYPDPALQPLAGLWKQAPEATTLRRATSLQALLHGSHPGPWPLPGGPTAPVESGVPVFPVTTVVYVRDPPHAPPPRHPLSPPCFVNFPSSPIQEQCRFDRMWFICGSGHSFPLFFTLKSAFFVSPAGVGKCKPVTKAWGPVARQEEVALLEGAGGTPPHQHPLTWACSEEPPTPVPHPISFCPRAPHLLGPSSPVHVMAQQTLEMFRFAAGLIHGCASGTLSRTPVLDI